jgi:WD40 repeat protein
MFSHDRRIIELEISPDGNWLAALGNNWNDLGNNRDEKGLNLALWDLQTGQRQHLVEVSKEGGALGGRLEVSWDGKRIGVGAPLRILDSTTLEDTGAIQVWGGRGALAFSPDGQFVASASGLTDTGFEILSLVDGQLVDRLIGHEHGVLDLAYSPMAGIWPRQAWIKRWSFGPRPHIRRSRRFEAIMPP